LGGSLALMRRQMVRVKTDGVIGTSLVPKAVWRSPVALFRWFNSGSRSRFGDAAIVIFLLAQAADGVMTYVGVSTSGASIEANPILQALMTSFGYGAVLLGAKLTAGGLGVALHLVGVHRLVAVLSGVYVVFAVVPWAGLLLFA
jgi:uncharacterized membrane protein